jgi:hypothetical protein
MLNQALGRLLFTGALAALSFSARGARADQFVVAEATYTHSAQTTTDSHYRVKPTAETPVNWQSPVDYTQGSVHVRLDVKTKPSATPTRYQICFEMKMNYCCTDQAPPYTTIGVYEWDTDVEKLWRPGPVDFTKGIVQSALILKDTNNVKPSPENVGAATSALYMPSDLSVTVTVVSNDAVYQPPADPQMPSGGNGGGGAGGLAAIAGGGASAAGSANPGGGGVGGSAGSTGVIIPEPSGGTGGAQAPMPSAGAATAIGGNGLSDAGAADAAGCQLGAARAPGRALSVWLGVGAWLLIRRRCQRSR